MSKSRYSIHETEEFTEWFEQETEKSKLQIRSRLDNIEYYGHFGIYKSVTADNSVWELKWENGRRIYYAYFEEENILILLGGNKNGQDKAIKKAQKILSRIIKES